MRRPVGKYRTRLGFVIVITRENHIEAEVKVVPSDTGFIPKHRLRMLTLLVTLIELALLINGGILVLLVLRD
jgi:hypothetical protein